MELRRPQKNQDAGGLADAQTPRQRRFRIVKLEERIAPKKNGWAHNTKACATGDCPVEPPCPGDGSWVW